MSDSIPVKVHTEIVDLSNNQIKTRMVERKTYLCPSCERNDMVVKGRKVNFCPWCGQKVSWEE